MVSVIGKIIGKNLEGLERNDNLVIRERFESHKILFFAATAILIAISISALQFQSNEQYNLDEPLVDSIEFQDRNGNIAITKLYILKLENGSEFRYSKTIPGPGMLCDTNNSKGDCETETEPGYTEINSTLSSSEYRKQEQDFSTYYYPENRKCVAQITESNIKISDCS